MPLRVDNGVQGSGGAYAPGNVGDVFATAGYCGRSFNEGLIRFHDSASAPAFREHVATAFPELARTGADVLAFDWQGRQLVATNNSGTDDTELVVADIGRGEVSEFGSLSQFTNILRHDDLTAQLFEEDLFTGWKQTVGGAGLGLPFTDCVTFTLPLYLGGTNEPTNLEQGDMDMAWTIGAALWEQARDLPPGTPITFTT